MNLERMTIQKIIYILVVALALHSCTADSKSSQEASLQKPNVLFISVDDLNDYLGFLGDPNAITPHMDE